MSAEIYYFSGTGNSFYIAKELQKRIPDSVLIPIASLLHEKNIRTKGEIVGFVFPVHALTIPIAVKKFMNKLNMESAEYVFSVATRLGMRFNGFNKVDKILKKKNKSLDSYFVLNMCNNDVKGENYSCPTNEDILKMESGIQEQLRKIQEYILSRMVYREVDEDYLEDLPYSKPVNIMMEKLVIGLLDFSEHIGGVNYFYTDLKCNGCGVCEKVCLSSKVKMLDKKPDWQKDVLCYMCYACINYCPKQSVQIKSIPGLKSYTEKNDRYSHPYASIQDIENEKKSEQ